MLNLDNFESTLSGKPTKESAWQAYHVSLDTGKYPSFTALCGKHGIVQLDRIDNQLDELAQVRFPAANGDEDRREFLKALASEHGGTEHYGSWVYLPWERKIVHVLAREDFFDVVTSRNQDKITRDEQLLLRKKNVAVVGLSVGAEIAVTVAQEHLCGRIVIADFDRLDLSNLNRLSAGVDDLGVNKAHLAARRIAKIDPFLDIEVFDEGISADNVDRALDGVDLLIDECDDLVMKYYLREYARERRLNMVFAADERGMLSIEPYSDTPDLAPFHGLVSGPPRPKDSFASPKEFMKSLTDWLGGWEAISERSRQSVDRIGETLCGYPQLASEPRLAAGQVGNVVRRMLLGERIDPFFAFLDPAEQIQ